MGKPVCYTTAAAKRIYYLLPPRAAAGFLMVFNQIRDMAFEMSLLFEVCTSCPENCDILLLINRCDQEGSKQTGAERSG